jgi:hypothetical protein
MSRIACVLKAAPGSSLSLRILIGSLLITLAPALHAQWLTQSFVLTNGWNAIFLHVDASHTNLDLTVGNDASNPILEVWRWNSAASIQFVDDPLKPINTGSQWSTWDRTDPNSSLQRLTGNSAYLVRVATNVSTYTWNVQGKPVAPVNDWTSSGLNLIGFPTVPNGPPTFESFLAQSPDLQQNAEIYSYRGGDLNSNNPVRLLAFRNLTVQRGQAYWVRAGTVFNRYFGPFELDLKSSSAVNFQDNLNSYAFVLRNLTPTNLTVTLHLLSSETPPAGQSPIVSTPPLLVQGTLNLTNFTYGYANLSLNSEQTWTLAPQGQPGSEVQVVLGLNRSVMTNRSPGDLFAGILRFTDSLGYSQLYAPVSAVVGSAAGLWVGQASVNQVGEYLKTYQLDAQGDPIVGTNGQFVRLSTNTALGSVPRPFPLRLLIHNPASGPAMLLQRVFVGLDANTNTIVASKESFLNPSLLAQARRISATHLPWSLENQPWQFSGSLSFSSTLTTSVLLDYNDRASSPFIHEYHPDHDNLDATFQNVLVQGAESYSVRRDITLSVNPPANDFASLTTSGQTLAGSYAESITILGFPNADNSNDSHQFQVRGTFYLNRIANIPILTSSTSP